MTHTPADHILDEFLAKHDATVALPEFSEVLGKLRAAMLAEASPHRWWICTNWLTPHNGTDSPGVKIAGPFRDQNEALENRARIEIYTGGRTFYVDEAADQ